MHGPLRKRRGRKRRLVRRLREAVKLFACPVRRHPAMATAEQKLHVSEFTNEPFVDFSKAENRRAMEEALKKVAGEFSREYPMYIGGEKGHDFGKAGVHQSLTSLAGDRDVSSCHRGDGQAGGRGCAQSIRLLEARADGTARGMSFSSREDSSRAEIRDQRADVLRSRQDLAGSGRGHGRNNRLLRILRARNAAPGGAPEAYAHERREELPCVYSTRSGSDYPTVEFPLRDHGRAGGGVARDGQHRGAQAGERFA